MSSAPLDALVRHQHALIAALDADDPAAIVASSQEMEQALVQVRAAAAPYGLEAKALAEESLRLADAARVRVNVLADLTGRRLDRCSAATGRPGGAVYGRNAKLVR